MNISMARSASRKAPGVAARPVVSVLAPVVQAHRDGEKPGAAQGSRQVRRQRRAGGEKLHGAAVRRPRDDPDDIRVEQRLAPREPEPEDAHRLEVGDDTLDRRRVHDLARAALVVAISAALRAGVRQADLGVGRTVQPADQVLIDEPPVGAAVERRQVGMENDVSAHRHGPEFPEVAEQEEVERRPHAQNPGVPGEGPQERQPILESGHLFHFMIFRRNYNSVWLTIRKASGILELYPDPQKDKSARPKR